MDRDERDSRKTRLWEPQAETVEDAVEVAEVSDPEPEVPPVVEDQPKKAAKSQRDVAGPIYRRLPNGALTTK